MTFTGLLNKTCQIQRFTKTQSNTGEIVKNWATISTPKCRISKTGVSGSSNLATPYVDATHTGYFKIDENILDRDRILFNGRTYEIIAVLNDSSFHHKEVYIKEIIQT